MKKDKYELKVDDLLCLTENAKNSKISDSNIDFKDPDFEDSNDNKNIEITLKITENKPKAEIKVIDDAETEKHKNDFLKSLALILCILFIPFNIRISLLSLFFCALLDYQTNLVSLLIPIALYYLSTFFKKEIIKEFYSIFYSFIYNIWIYLIKIFKKSIDFIFRNKKAEKKCFYEEDKRKD